MTIYLYRCPEGHEHDLDFPMGKAPELVGGGCPTVLGTYQTHDAFGLHTREHRCGNPLKRVFTPILIVHGPGFIGPGLAPWSDKIQKSKEAQDRFGKGEL